MKNNLPSVIVTGASGLVGRYFLQSVKDDFYIYAIARRSSIEANIPIHQNIQWIQWDISNRSSLNETTKYIHSQGGADYVIHLAGYYDFDYVDKPQYQSTNVTGTKNLLEMARDLRVKRFLFASSLAACRFPSQGGQITEKTPPDAGFPYAISKKKGELMVEQYSKYFACSVIRFAAVFSDWCEYAPLYKFMITWLSNHWNARILGGRGNSAITFIHIHDLRDLLMTIIKKSRFLPQYDVYIASPDGSVSHKQLFEHTTSNYFGKHRKPIFTHRMLAYLGIHFQRLLFKAGLTGNPFEKPWMLKYLDLKLEVDASYTREVLGWQPTQRYTILRRLLFLLVNLKTHPTEWHIKNKAALENKGSRINLILYDHLVTSKSILLDRILESLTRHDKKKLFYHYQAMGSNALKIHIDTIYNLLLATVRSGDRGLMLKYVDDIAFEVFPAGFEVREVVGAFQTINQLIVALLSTHTGLATMKQEIHDYITLVFQLAEDQIEDAFEELDKKFPDRKIVKTASKPEVEMRDKLILKLSKPYQVYSSENKKTKESDEEIRFSIYDMR